MATPAFHTEGESNTSEMRQRWLEKSIGPKSAPLLKRDADTFLHQSLSSPCVSTIAKASGIWIEDKDGRRFMDFHGNSVHHLGYGHPRLVAAIKAQLDDLPFAPRRFTCDPAVELAEKLVDLEDYFRRWRFNHVTTVERVIGFKRGTGGTGGVSYLKRMLDVELFPELWHLRTAL